jgi:hypothetical protein
VRRTFTKPSTDLHPELAVRHRATGSPFDRTVVPPAAVLPPGRHVRAPGAVDENAFAPGRKTVRKDPRRFLHAHSGIGGAVTTVLAAPLKAAVPRRVTSKPASAGAFSKRDNPPNTELRRFYERGDLPCIIDQRGVHNKLAWKVEISRLDLHHYLPLFFDGLRETEHPYKFIAREGVMDMLEWAGGAKILPVVPQLIIPVKNALNTRDEDVIAFVCRVLQKLVTADVDAEGKGGLIGQALVPYYRQILPILNLFFSKNKNLGDEFEYGQRKGTNIGDLIHETLGVMQRYGGDDAFVNIKYMVPLWSPGGG